MSRQSDQYMTPKWIFEALNITFDLDVACPLTGPPHNTAKHYYTEETDGLTSLWFGNVWMNPPFSNGTPWVHKFMEHRNGICLVPTAKSKWFNELWADADGFVMLPSNLKFESEHNKTGSIFIATMLAAYGDANVKALESIGRVR